MWIRTAMEITCSHTALSSLAGAVGHAYRHPVVSGLLDSKRNDLYQSRLVVTLGRLQTCSTDTADDQTYPVRTLVY